MNTNQQNAWRRVVLPLTLACLFGIVVYATLIALPTAAANDLPNRANIAPRPTLLTDTLTYTIFLPIVFSPPCPYQSTRSPLQGTANFAGEIKIKTPLHCVTGWPTESPIVASGTYTNTPANVTLWVLAYAPNGLYYPQAHNACEGTPPIQMDGNWLVTTYLGMKGGDPEWFDLVVILADETASQFLSAWVKQGCLDKEFKGLTGIQLNQFAITEKRFISIQTED